MLWWVLHQLRGTLASYWMTNCAAQPTSPWWPNPADLLSTTSAGSDPSSQGKQHSSWSKHSSSPASTTATRSWLGHPASAIKHLQRIQNAAARLVFNLPKFSHVSPLFCDLHWLPVAARIRFKTMVLTYKAVNGTPTYHLQALVRPHAPARTAQRPRPTGWYRHPWEQVKVAQPSHNSSLSWRHYGGTSSLLRWGPQSSSPASTRDSRPTCSGFTWTPLSIPPLLPLPIIKKGRKRKEKKKKVQLFYVCMSWHLHWYFVISIFALISVVY